MQTAEELAGADPRELGADDLSLADIADLDLGSVEAVRFEVLPRGVFAFEIEECKLDVKGEENTPVMSVAMKVIEVDTLTDPLPEGKEEDSFIDKKHTEAFWFKDQDGLGRFRAFAEDAGLEVAGSIRDVAEALTGHRFMGLVKHRKSRNDPSVVFAGLTPKGPVE